MLEDAWDGKQLPTTDHFAMLSNSDAFGPTRVALTELDVTGAIVMHCLIFDPANPGDKLIGRSLELELGANGQATGYYVTGAMVGASGSRLVIFRTTLTGAPTWVRYLPNTANGAVAYDEIGMSLERQSNGDIIVVGRSKHLATGTQRMIAGRFTPTGGLVWMNRYNPPANTHIIPAESCNGLRTNQNVAVIGVAGQYIDAQSNIRTFGSCIDAATGSELWRRYYNSTLASDEGFDIVMNPANKKFMIVGRATTTAGQNNLWVVNVPTSNGALAVGASTVYSLGADDLVARDVSLGTTATRAAIAGYHKYTNSNGVVETRAILMRLPFTNGANPDWIRRYDASSPIGSGSESVVPVTATAAAVAGYFITTDGLPTNAGWAAHGAHPIYADANGNHPYGECPITTLQVGKVQQGNNATLAKTKNAVDVTPYQLICQQLQAAIAACNTDGVPPLGGEGDERRESDNSLTINASTPVSIAPNPVAAGQMFNVTFAATGKAELALFDLTGKLIWHTNAENDGETTLQISTQGLAAGTYLLRLQTAEGLQTARVVVGRN